MSDQDTITDLSTNVRCHSYNHQKIWLQPQFEIPKLKLAFKEHFGLKTYTVYETVIFNSKKQEKNECFDNLSVNSED